MRIIIDNQSDLPDKDAMILISKIIGTGRISNNDKQYCYCITAFLYGKGYTAYSYLNKKSDRFVIVNDENVSDEPY